MDTFHLCVLSKRLSYILFVFPLSLFLWFKKQPPEVFFKKGVLENFTKFTEKHLCWSLFLIMLQAFRPATLLKERLWHMCFPVNFAKFWRKSFLQNTSGQLLLWLHALQWLLSLAWSKSQVRKMWWKLTFSSFKLI